MIVLYRHYDDQKNLLYVGISTKFHSRCYSHSSMSEWFSKVRLITVEHFENKSDAIEAERQAILKENPFFNKKISFPSYMQNEIFSSQDMFKKICSKNFTNEQIAALLGTSASTVFRWKKNFPKKLPINIFKKLKSAMEKLK